MTPFRFHRPTSIIEAVELHAGCQSPCYINGGQSLVPEMRKAESVYTDLIDLSGVDGLRGIGVSGHWLTIGASETHSRIADDTAVQQVISGLAAMASGIGDAQVRHRGTIGGSIAARETASDWSAALIGLEATIVTNNQEIEASRFFENGLEAGEVVVAARFRSPESACYVKQANPASGHAIAGVFVARYEDEYRVAITGVAKQPIRYFAAEAALKGDPEPTQFLAGDDLLDDLYASAEYRAALVDVLLERSVAGLDPMDSGP